MLHSEFHNTFSKGKAFGVIFVEFRYFMLHNMFNVNHDVLVDLVNNPELFARWMLV